MERLKGKVTIVTGAGHGIGRGVSLLFAKEGSRVVVADIVTEAAEETVEMIEASGGEAAYIQTDVAKAAEVESMVKFTIKKYGFLNVLCNNAGIMTGDSPLDPITNLPEENWDRIINVNLKGVFLCCKYAIPEMIKAGGGSIVNISSIAGQLISPHAAYAASKGGIIAFTKSVALQFAENNIRSNVICPGLVDTSGRVTAIKERGYKAKEITQRLIARPGTPEDIAQAAVYLASDEASYVTAAAFTIDGGTMGRRLDIIRS